MQFSDYSSINRIYDFHSKKAPKINNVRNISLFADSTSDDEGDEDDIPPDPSEYEHFFKVQVGDDIIYLENPVECNEAGWTPLHTCCMSFLTVTAGIALIEETVRLGSSLDVKTIAGPGNFNKGWTPLHM